MVTMMVQNLLGDSVLSRDLKFEKRNGSYIIYFVQLVYIMFYQWKMVANVADRYVQHLCIVGRLSKPKGCGVSKLQQHSVFAL